MFISQIAMDNISSQRESLSAHTANDDSPSETVLDLSVLTSFEEVQVEDEPDLIIELIDLYLEDAPRQMALMQKAVALADERTLKRAAHGLKGSSANLGIRRMAALCAELERANDSGDSLPAGKLILAEMHGEFERVRQALLAEKQRRLLK